MLVVQLGEMVLLYNWFFCTYSHLFLITKKASSSVKFLNHLVCTNFLSKSFHRFKSIYYHFTKLMVDKSRRPSRPWQNLQHLFGFWNSRFTLYCTSHLVVLLAPLPSINGLMCASRKTLDFSFSSHCNLEIKVLHLWRPHKACLDVQTQNVWGWIFWWWCRIMCVFLCRSSACRCWCTLKLHHKLDCSQTLLCCI